MTTSLKRFQKQSTYALATLFMVFASNMLSANSFTMLQISLGDLSGGTMLLITVAALIIFTIILLADKLLRLITTRFDGTTPSGLFSSEASNIDSSKIIRLKKGYNIQLEGQVTTKNIQSVRATTYSLKPTDFNGLAPIPKMLVQVGDEVKAGDQLFYDKKKPEIAFVAPVSGEIAEIKRGEKRSIIEIVILADKETSYKQFDAMDASKSSRADIVEALKQRGGWPLLTERPFGQLPNLNGDFPKAIFISGFDTAPLAVDYGVALAGQEADFQSGIYVLQQLTDGKVHLNLNAAAQTNAVFESIEGVQMNWFEGPHPAGNVGVQIHHIDAINKGDIVWTINAQAVTTLGKLIEKGIYDHKKVISVAGPCVANPGYIEVTAGASVETLIADNLKETDQTIRAISGSVLTGQQIDIKGHLGFDHDQVTLIEEGDYQEFLGWLVPSYARPSISPTFPNFLPFQQFNTNTNTHGEQRAFVMTGQYESVLPMDVYPVHLLKAILANDFEKMEGLGIYELLEEDLALCEFVCASKQPAQQILRDGIDYMIEQV